MVNTFWMVLFLKNVEKYEKTAVWGHTAWGAMVGLGSVGLKLSLRDLPPKKTKASSTAMMTAVHCL